MDETNRRHVLRLGAPSEKLSLLLEHDTRANLLEVPDPYHADDDAFELVYRLVNSACDALIDKLLRAQCVDRTP
jgi:protein-tyrosine phosphatase